VHLALAHRLEPKTRYMVMTAYFDESGTHGKESPTNIVAGFGATVQQWNGCEKRLKKLFGDYDVPHFHAKEFRGTDGPFKGWDKDTKGKFLGRFLRITDDQLSFGVAGIMSPTDYRQHYRGKPFPRTSRPDSAYGLCFRTALGRSLLNFCNQPHTWPLNVVLELGHKNAQDAVRVFEEVKNDPRFNGLLGTISFAAKQDCMFLGLADSLAYALFRSTAGYTKHPTNPIAVPLGPCIPPYYVHKLQMSRTLIEKEGLKMLYEMHSASSGKRP
jgi:hypothetical protein